MDGGNQEFDDEIEFTERIELPERTMAELRGYLFAHESDIAHGINDFDSLRGAFVGMIGREPKA